MKSFKLMRNILMLSFFITLAGCAEEGAESVGSAESEITFGSRLDLHQVDGRYQAIGTIPGCSATLINHELVLTAAHCVCPGSSPSGCNTRSTFTMKNVTQTDDPATPVDESTLGPTDVSIGADVVVYPEFGDLGWLREDYAVLKLDEPVYDRAIGVVRHPLATSARTPTTSDTLAIAGYGGTGSDCSGSGALGRIGYNTPSEVVPDGIRFEGSVLSCPGDSGGPTLDDELFVLGVASWIATSGTSPTQATYRPAYEKYSWITDRIDEVENSADRARFDVSRGGSWDLGFYNDTYAEYWPEDGIVGQAISPVDGLVYTWYRNGTYSKGRTYDLRRDFEQGVFSVPAGYDADDIVDIAFSSSNRVYVWYKWGTATAGTHGRRLSG